MGVVLSAIFFGAVAVQLVYILFIFTKVIKHEDLETPSIQTKLPSVSVIIAASNELENLKELLPMLDQQDYPNFEILVSDDRSADGTYDFLLNNEAKIKHLNFLRIKDLPAHFTAKKYAVTMPLKNQKTTFYYLPMPTADLLLTFGLETWSINLPMTKILCWVFRDTTWSLEA